MVLRTAGGFAAQGTASQELSVSNVAKLPQQKVEMLFSDMSNEEKNSFRIAIQNELGTAMDVAAHDCMGSAEVQMTYAKKYWSRAARY